jgi:hypothetical protein
MAKAKRSRDTEFGRLADAAMREAAIAAIERAEQTGTQLVIWHEGKVQKVWPNEVKFARRERERRRKARGG